MFIPPLGMMWCCCNPVELQGCLGNQGILTIDDPFDDASLSRPWIGIIDNYLVSGGLIQGEAFNVGPIYWYRAISTGMCIDTSSWPIGQYIESYIRATGESPVPASPVQPSESIKFSDAILEYVYTPSFGSTALVRLRVGATTYYSSSETYVPTVELRLKITRTGTSTGTYEAWYQEALVHTETGAPMPTEYEGVAVGIIHQTIRNTTGSTTGFDSNFGLEHLYVTRSW